MNIHSEIEYTIETWFVKRHIRKAQKAPGHKRIDTTAKHYVLDELEEGLTDDTLLMY